MTYKCSVGLELFLVWNIVADVIVQTLLCGKCAQLKVYFIIIKCMHMYVQEGEVNEERGRVEKKGEGWYCLD